MEKNKLGLNVFVDWDSQSQGTIKTKTGLIVAVVPAGERPNRTRFNGFAKDVSGWGRHHESYVVEVDVGKVPVKALKYYWPRVNLLKIKEGALNEQ